MYVILSGEKVRELREERGFGDKRSLAEAARVSPDTVRRIEGGKGSVRLASVRKIARALDLEHPVVLATADPRDSVVRRA